MSIKRPFVSVCIIARNEALRIWRALESLVAQNYPKDRYWIIVVDGNSTDGTRGVCDTILRKSKIRYAIINDSDWKGRFSGAQYWHSFARNVALSNLFTETRYVAWTDGDCFCPERWLSALVYEKEISPSDVVAVWWPRLIDTHGADTYELVYHKYLTSSIMSLWNPAFVLPNPEARPFFCVSVAWYNSLYDAEALKQYGYCTRFPTYVDDNELNFRIRKDGKKILFVPDAPIYHRLEDDFFGLLSRMRNYGIWSGRLWQIHKSSARPYALISLAYLAYALAMPILILKAADIWMPVLVPLLPFGVFFLLSLGVFVENVRFVRNWKSLLVIPLAFLHPLAYAFGFLKGVSDKPIQE